MLTFKTPNDMPDDEFLALGRDEFASRFTHKNITLTHDDAVMLTTYILLTTQYRRGEAEAWAKLAEERNEDGTPTFKNAQSNAEWWERLCARIESIRKTIDDSPLIEKPEN